MTDAKAARTGIRLSPGIPSFLATSPCQHSVCLFLRGRESEIAMSKSKARKAVAPGKRPPCPWCLVVAEAMSGWGLRAWQERGGGVGHAFGGRGHVPGDGTESLTGRCGENLISRPMADPSMDRGDSESAGVVLFLAGAAMGSAGTGADRFGTRFLQAMGEDRVGMRCGPAVGQHFFQIRGVRVQAE